MTNLPEISFVIPLYNENENFSYLVERLNQVMDSLPLRSEVVLIDDGSKDQTPVLMYDLALKDKRYHSVFLSRNHGHQIALSAGLAHCRGTKAIMVLDGDLQDPPELVHDFLKKLEEGYDVVYGVRQKRKEGPVKKLAYWSFYRLMNSISSTPLPLDSGDFSLVSRKVVNYLVSMPEQNRYLRGMRAWLGFKQIGVEYDRAERFAGTTKYSWKKLFQLAYSGIFNFSTFPVKLITRMGVATILFSFIYIIYIFLHKYYTGNVPKGFTSLVIFLALFNGVQLISIGIIGEYVMRNYIQSQQRPLFIIKNTICEGEIQS
jgi:glycosyltransferase involved in cell wall biosynthesis